MYIRPLYTKRNNLGEINIIPDLICDTEFYQKYFRMTKDSFNIIFNKIKDRISNRSTHRHPISPEIRLAITLR